MDHQDWNTVILRKKQEKSKSSAPTPSVQYVKQNDPDPENNPTKKVTPKLKAAFIQARNAAHLNHAQLASKISVPVQDIKDLENGKMLLKAAKQIALKAEKILKVKILT